MPRRGRVHPSPRAGEHGEKQMADRGMELPALSKNHPVSSNSLRVLARGIRPEFLGGAAACQQTTRTGIHGRCEFSQRAGGETFCPSPDRMHGRPSPNPAGMIRGDQRSHTDGADMVAFRVESFPTEFR